MCVCVCVCEILTIESSFLTFSSIVCFEILNYLDAFMLGRNALSISHYDFHALRFYDHQI